MLCPCVDPAIPYNIFFMWLILEGNKAGEVGLEMQVCDSCSAVSIDSDAGMALLP